jgi:hypothetical protein
MRMNYMQVVQKLQKILTSVVTCSCNVELPSGWLTPKTTLYTLSIVYLRTLLGLSKVEKHYSIVIG